MFFSEISTSELGAYLVSAFDRAAHARNFLAIRLTLSFSLNHSISNFSNSFTASHASVGLLTKTGLLRNRLAKVS